MTRVSNHEAREFWNLGLILRDARKKCGLLRMRIAGW